MVYNHFLMCVPQGIVLQPCLFSIQVSSNSVAARGGRFILSSEIYDDWCTYMASCKRIVAISSGCGTYWCKSTQFSLSTAMLKLLHGLCDQQCYSCESLYASAYFSYLVTLRLLLAALLSHLFSISPLCLTIRHNSPFMVFVSLLLSVSHYCMSSMNFF